MDFIDKAVSKFCYRHPKFGIRNLMLYIVVGNVFVYLVALMDSSGAFLQALAFYPGKILRGQVWRLFTFLFIPSDYNPIYLLLTLYLYYFIGSALERQWGAARFTIYYLSGWLFNVIFGFICYAFGSQPGLDAYYLNMSLFFAFAVLWPDHTLLLMFIIPIKIKWLAYLDAALFIVSVVRYSSLFPLNLLPIVAVLNFLLFLGPSLFRQIFRKRSYATRRVQFKAASRRAERTEAHAAYRHKCAVCGRTDADHPELEFRYCSRCKGYHCFCQDHINNHVHFTE